MSIPSRNASATRIETDLRTFFVTSKAESGRNLLQSERMAALLIDVLRSYHSQGKFLVHDFVVMPNHFHLLLTLDRDVSVEKAVQLIKGNFSFRAKRELGFIHEIWQRGFSDERVWDHASFVAHRNYIGKNPVEAGLAHTPEGFPYSSFHFRARKKAGAKAPSCEKRAAKRHD